MPHNFAKFRQIEHTSEFCLPPPPSPGLLSKTENLTQKFLVLVPRISFTMLFSAKDQQTTENRRQFLWRTYQITQDRRTQVWLINLSNIVFDRKARSCFLTFDTRSVNKFTHSRVNVFHNDIPTKPTPPPPSPCHAIKKKARWLK